MQFNTKAISLALSSAITVGLGQFASAQTTLYNVTFSNPFVVGNLDGQQSFITDELAPDFFKVEAAGRNGQGVVYDMSTDTAGTAWAWLDVTEAIAANTVYVGTAWVKIDSDPLHPTLFSGVGLDVYGGSDSAGTGFARVATLHIRADNAIRMYSSSVATSVNTAAVDQWHRLDLVVDKGANKCYGLVDGVDTGLSVTGVPAYIYDCDLLGVGSGYNVAHFDDYSLVKFGPTQQTIQGKVSLQDFPPGPEGRTIYVDLLDGSDNVVATATGTADADGYYRAQTTASGTFRAAVRGSHWLRKTAKASLTLTGSTPFQAIPAVDLVNGDVDGDNVVSVFDYIILSDSFDLATGDTGFVEGADLDGDGVVSVFDYIILSDNFDKAGE